MRRHRPDPVAAEQAAARVVAALVRPAGWTPPPAHDEPWPDASPAAVHPVDSVVAVEPVAAVASVAVAEPVAAVASVAAVEPVPAVESVGAAPPAGPDASPAVGWRAHVPSTLLGGRLDPGRSGALALVAVAVVAGLLAGAVLLRGRPQEVAAPSVVASGAPLPGASPATDGLVVVAVAGKVRRPGLVRLPVGARVDDAVKAAGGLTPGASPGLLNLARRLVDGEQVLVGVDVPAGSAAGATPGGLLDLNTATPEQLDDLPGVGPVLAERIVDWRTEHGRFASVDQLREVSGIGESKYSSMKSKVRV